MWRSPNIIIGTSLDIPSRISDQYRSDRRYFSGHGVLYFYLVFHKGLRASEAAAVGSNQTYPDPSEAITDKKGFIISTVIFLCAVAFAGDPCTDWTDRILHRCIHLHRDIDRCRQRCAEADQTD